MEDLWNDDWQRKTEVFGKRKPVPMLRHPPQMPRELPRNWSRDAGLQESLNYRKD